MRFKRVVDCGWPLGRPGGQTSIVGLLERNCMALCASLAPNGERSRRTISAVS